MVEKGLVQTLEQETWIDRSADPLQAGVRGLLDRNPRVASALHGDWMGHPLHAALTDLPVGAWTAGFVLDMADTFGSSRRLRPGTDAVHVIGLVGALGAAVAGIADWSKTSYKARRVGFVHGATNGVIALLYGASIAARSRRRRGLAKVLSCVGFGLLAFSGWLGGTLAYNLGVGQRRGLPERRAREERDEDEIASELDVESVPESRL